MSIGNFIARNTTSEALSSAVFAVVLFCAGYVAILAYIVNPTAIAKVQSGNRNLARR